MKHLDHVVNALPANADAFDTTQYTKVINMKDWNHIKFIVAKGVGASGTYTVTAEACSDAAASVVSAVPFVYKECVANDVFGIRTRATAAGVNDTAGSNGVMVIDLDAESLLASGYSYIRLKFVEVVNSPVLASVIAVLSEGRYEQAIADTTLV